MRRCDYCGAEFEPRKMGRPQRFCPGGRCHYGFYKEAPRAYVRVLKTKRRPKLTEEERVKRAKDRAADKLEAYTAKRKAEKFEIRNPTPLFELRGISSDPSAKAFGRRAEALAKEDSQSAICL